MWSLDYETLSRSRFRGLMNIDSILIFWIIYYIYFKQLLTVGKPIDFVEASYRLSASGLTKETLIGTKTYNSLTTMTTPLGQRS